MLWITASRGIHLRAPEVIFDWTRHWFTSKERDNETNPDYFGSRYYSSNQGGFASTDPANYQALLNLIYPQSWNAYGYVNNNPLRYLDTDGRGIGDFFEKLRTS
jgi:RHS repeat-associated protein